MRLEKFISLAQSKGYKIGGRPYFCARPQDALLIETSEGEFLFFKDSSSWESFNSFLEELGRERAREFFEEISAEKPVNEFKYKLTGYLSDYRMTFHSGKIIVEVSGDYISEKEDIKTLNKSKVLLWWKSPRRDNDLLKEFEESLKRD